MWGCVMVTPAATTPEFLCEVKLFLPTHADSISYADFNDLVAPLDNFRGSVILIIYFLLRQDSEKGRWEEQRKEEGRRSFH